MRTTTIATVLSLITACQAITQEVNVDVGRPSNPQGDSTSYLVDPFEPGDTTSTGVISEPEDTTTTGGYVDTPSSTGDTTTTSSTGSTSTDDTTSTGEPEDTSTGTTADPAPYCGDGHVDPSELCDTNDPIDGVGCTADCTYDFSEVPQLFCAGSCSWGGGTGCDQADADLFCHLRTDNVNAVALSFTLIKPTDAPGFACADVDVDFQGPDPRVDLGPALDIEYIPYVEALASTHGGGPVAAIDGTTIVCEAL